MNDLGPKPGFTERVMSQVATRPLPRPSLWQRISRPRTFTFSPLRLAGAALAVAVVATLLMVERPRPAAPTVAQVRVRFSLAAPDASQVSVAGDFNGWQETAAERGPDGLWHLTLPLPPGSWSYSFVVDGKFIQDPQAEAWRDDGFGGRNAVVRVN